MFSPEGSGQLDYLISRGLTEETIRQFQLGAVVGLHEGSEDQQAAGRICIPYLTPTGVVSLRFRAMDPNANAKYWQHPGSLITIFNTTEITKPREWICIAEGEIDCMTAVQAGIPCVGLPGANSWKPWYGTIFAGYQTINILADGDQPGLQFAQTVAEEVSGVRILQMPQGEDVNSAVQDRGEAWLRKLVTGGS